MNGMLPATAATKQRPVYGIENHFASLHPKDTTQGQQQKNIYILFTFKQPAKHHKTLHLHIFLLTL